MLYLSKEGCALAGGKILFIAEGFWESPEGFVCLLTPVNSYLLN